MAAILIMEVMAKAEGVIVFPAVLKAAFVVGASYGRGAMVCTHRGRHLVRVLDKNSSRNESRKIRREVGVGIRNELRYAGLVSVSQSMYTDSTDVDVGNRGGLNGSTQHSGRTQLA